MAHRAAPISVSIALGHASANAVKATVGGWSTGSPASLTFPLHSHMLSTRREGSEYHFKSLWFDSAGVRTYDLPVVRRTLNYWAITPVFLYIFLHLYRHFFGNEHFCHKAERVAPEVSRSFFGIA